MDDHAPTHTSPPTQPFTAHASPHEALAALLRATVLGVTGRAFSDSTPQPCAPDFPGLAAFALTLERSGIFAPRKIEDQPSVNGVPVRSRPFAAIVPPNANGVASAALQTLTSIAIGTLISNGLMSSASPWIQFLTNTFGTLIDSCEEAAETGDLFVHHPIALEILAGFLRGLLVNEHAGLRNAPATRDTTRRSQPNAKTALRQARAIVLAEHAASLSKTARELLDGAGRKLGDRDPGRYWSRATAVERLVDAFSSADTHAAASVFYSVVGWGQ